MLFYCREVFRRRSPAAAVRAAGAVQQLAASQQLLTALNKVEIRWKNDIFVGFQKGRSGPEKRDFGIGSSFRAMLFYCREVFRRRSPAAAGMLHPHMPFFHNT